MSRATRHLASALFLTALQLSCAARPRAGSANDVPVAPLPAVFRGVSWSTTPETLGTLFPGAEISRTPVSCEDGSKCLDFATTTQGWAGFGSGFLSLYGPEGGAPGLVGLTAVNIRPDCHPRENPRPADCLDRPGPELDAVFDRMRLIVEKELGPGTVLPGFSGGVAHGYPPDPRERAVHWKRQGYGLTLSLAADEFFWSVELQAVRGR